MHPDTRKRLEQLLADTHIVSQSVLDKAKDQSDETLPSVLVENGADKKQVLDLLAEVFQIPSVDLTEELIEFDSGSAGHAGLFLKHHAIPLRMEEGSLYVAFADPQNIAAVDEVRAALGKPVHPRVALAADVRKALNLQSETDEQEDHDARLEDGDVPVRLTTRSEASKPVVKLLDKVIQDALRRKAMHLYLIPFPDGDTRVRVGIKGKILETHRYPRRLHSKVVNRLRVLCDLLGKDKRAPQNGAYLTLVDETKHRLDVMIVPAPAGEAVTIFFDQDLDMASAEALVCSNCETDLQSEWKFCPMCGTQR